MENKIFFDTMSSFVKQIAHTNPPNGHLYELLMKSNLSYYCLSAIVIRFIEVILQFLSVYLMELYILKPLHFPQLGSVC